MSAIPGFLQRLALAASPSASSARVALAPRFAGPGAGESESVFEAPQPRAATHQSELDGAPSTPIGSHFQVESGTALRDDTQRVRGPERIERRPVELPRQASAEPAQHLPLVHAALPPAASPMAPAATLPTAPATAAPRTGQRLEPVRVDTVPHDRVQPPTSGRTTPPLRASTVAQHAAAARAQAAPTVVQVTIDRIDVRAAAPPPAVHRAPKARVPAAQSLTDYLRPRSGGPP